MQNPVIQPAAVTNPELLAEVLSSASNFSSEIAAKINPSDIGISSTDDINEGSNNLYYTDARADARAQAIVDATVAGAGAAYDTLLELQNELQGNDADITAILTAQSANTTAISNNASAIALNTAKVSADGSIDTHSDVDTSGQSLGDVLKFDGSNYIPANTLENINLDGLNFKKGEPPTPPAGYISIFEDATTGEIKKKDENGDISVIIGKTEQLTITTTNNTWGLLKNFAADVPLNGTLFLNGTVKGNRTDGTFGYAAYGYRVAYANNGGTITEIMDAKDWTEETTANYNVRSRILNGDPVIEVRGNAGHTMEWTANFQQT